MVASEELAGRSNGARLVDGFGRHISYLRLSVTDRCDLRCAYCLPERAVFQPKREILTLEELEVVAREFVGRGVNKIRLTGGEPLVRRDVMQFIARVGGLLEESGLKELTLTTNGTMLAQYAGDLVKAGVRRINVSLDTLDPQKFAALTRRDALPQVLAGIDAALGAGLNVKINTVALKDFNVGETPALIEWAHARGMELTLIEVMPMGEVDAHREDQFVSLADVRRDLERRWTMTPDDHRTGGPARYVRVEETGGRLGFITPLSANFCDGCNRVRVTCSGELFMCLGREGKIDLKRPLRDGGPAALSAAIDEAMRLKPRRHDFNAVYEGAADAEAPGRVMALTGG